VRLHPNAPKSGEHLLLLVESIPPKCHLPLDCTIELYESDRGLETTGAPQDTLLAKFDARLVRTGSGRDPKYVFDRVGRVDNLEKNLPPPEAQVFKGRTLNLTARWCSPHFILQFPTSTFALSPRAKQYPGCPSHTVLIKSKSVRPEQYVFEVFFKVYVSGAVVRSSHGHPTLINCTNCVVHNCAEAARVLLEGHREVIRRRLNIAVIQGAGRRCGTHYGLAWATASARSAAAARGLERIGCDKYAWLAMKTAHAKTRLAKDWEDVWNARRMKVRNYKRWNAVTIAKLLREKLGWEVLYYNFNSARTNAVDNASYANAVYHNVYWFPGLKYEEKYKIPIIDVISSRQARAVWRKKLDWLKRVPFAFGTWRAAVHTGMVLRGTVYEVHYHGGPDDSRLFEKACTIARWMTGRSGIIAMPGGMWDWARRRGVVEAY